MIHANTIEQFHILRWLEANFNMDCIEVSFIDCKSARIKDMNGDGAIVTYIGKNNIVLN